ncbi:hypothetical protein CYMTET_8652 [Cymbomonas tetramitiformis]|uniref:Uncharacterized protein n=1 Tax=Cymbomonas tetramitiformis TaxID=36881 RepID=A0AAE0GSK1_9CHLO|nr:hypothetical protein CYMTET_8652 [Cymbomonas tetramitiformis]
MLQQLYIPPTAKGDIENGLVRVLGGKDVYSFEADGSDTNKLATLVIALRQEILSAGLEIDVFNLDDPELVVHEDINKLVYDTLTCMVKPDSVADGFLATAQWY